MDETKEINAETKEINAETTDINAETTEINAEITDINVETIDINAETIDINAETLMRLDLLNKQLAELLQTQRKVALGCDYISASELAELLGEKMSTIYARVHNRKIPFYKPGGKILLFKLDEIQEWISAGRRATMEELRESI